MLAGLLLAPGFAAGQSYPSPTFQNLTVTNSFTVGGYQLTLPPTTAPITFQSGPTTPGDCAKWNSVQGALVDGACGSGGGGGLTSFNTRTGPAITLLSSDVTGALGFTPAPLASPTFTGTPVVPGYLTTAAAALLAPLASPTFTGAPVVPGYETTAAAALLAPLASPTFTGTPTVPGYLTTSSAASTYETQTSAALLAPLASPTFTGSPTIPGYLKTTGSGASLTGITYSQLPALSANTILGALTTATASGQAVPSCSGASNALTWTSGTGFGCNTISSGGGGQTAITSGSSILASPATTGGQPTTVTVSAPLTFSSNTLGITATAYGQGSTGALTAPSSTTVYQMSGAGSSCTLTPAQSGRAMVTFSGAITDAAGTTAANGMNFQIAYGTGTAPSNGAAASGTVISPAPGKITNPASATANSIYGFSHQAIVTGLTVGTAYWFDEQAEAVNTASRFAFVSIVCTEVEF